MLGIAVENAERGARITGVTPGGPGDEAGLEIGDLILSIDGVSLTADGQRAPARALVARLADVEPGQKVSLRIERDGREREVTVEAREAGWLGFAHNGPGAFTPPAVPSPRGFLQPFLGRWRDMELVSLTPELGAYFGTTEGLLVVRAPKDETLPLRDGDVILSIGDRKPTSPEHAMRILRSFEPGETLRLTIMRQRQQQTLEVELPKDAGAARDD